LQEIVHSTIRPLFPLPMQDSRQFALAARFFLFSSAGAEKACRAL
jgi:hypothetical protein